MQKKSKASITSIPHVLIPPDHQIKITNQTKLRPCNFATRVHFPYNEIGVIWTTITGILH